MKIICPVFMCHYTCKSFSDLHNHLLDKHKKSIEKHGINNLIMKAYDLADIRCPFCKNEMEIIDNHYFRCQGCGTELIDGKPYGGI